MAAADRRVSRPEPAAGDRDHGGSGPGSGGGGDARHIPAGERAQRGHGGAGGPQFIGRRPVGDLRRVRLGHRHLRGSADRGREDRRRPRPDAEGRPAATGPDLLDHGAGDARRHVERRRHHAPDRGADARRLGGAAAAPHHPRCRPGGGDGRRAEAVPGARRSGGAAQVRPHARRGGGGGAGEQFQRHRRLPEPGRQRAPGPLPGAHPGRP